MKAKVSIVVPVYNGEQYLENCLDSLIHQTLDNIEIIIINDGSTDNTQNIIDNYKNKYSNIKSFTTKNNGLSDARNIGISFCTGEYIGFVDCDDYVEPEMYEKLFTLASNNNFDVVACNYNEIYKSYKKTTSSGIRTNGDAINLKDSIYLIMPVVWNKIYKRSFFDNGLRFKSGIYFEDVDFTYRLLPHIESVGIINEPLYNYIQRPDSLSHIYNKQKLDDILQIWNNLFKYYKNLGLFDANKDELEYTYFRYAYNMFDRMPYEQKDISYDTLKSNIEQNMASPFSNKYLINFISTYNIYGEKIKLHP